MNRGVGLREVPRALVITLLAIVSLPFQWINDFIVFLRLRKTAPLKDPVFIIGHWRSGTTFLHYLMAKDPQFGFLDYYNAFFPNLALAGGSWLRKTLTPLMPQRRPQDNIELQMTLPTEEENPLATRSLRSASHSFFFPSNEAFFKKYAVFEGTSGREKHLWKKAYKYLMKRISVVHPGKWLLIKNPHNTGRVRELMEIFPRARFIHIYRNPYDIFPSTKLMYDRVVTTQFLHDFSDEQVNDKIIYYYKKVMKRYFNTRSEIPKDQLVEVKFEDFEKDPMAAIKNIYRTFDINLDPVARDNMQAYIDQVRSYKKNIHVLDDRLKKRVGREWNFGFEKLGYTA